MRDELYQEELMDHFKNPRNHGSLKNPDFISSDDNPSCGDSVIIEGIISNGVLEQISFSGKGCVLSQATASMLTEKCKGKKIEEILALSTQDVLNIIDMTLGPNRLKCALLPLQVLKQGISSYKKSK